MNEKEFEILADKYGFGFQLKWRTDGVDYGLCTFDSGAQIARKVLKLVRNMCVTLFHKHKMSKKELEKVMVWLERIL